MLEPCDEPSVLDDGIALDELGPDCCEELTGGVALEPCDDSSVFDDGAGDTVDVPGTFDVPEGCDESEVLLGCSDEPCEVVGSLEGSGPGLGGFPL